MQGLSSARDGLNHMIASELITKALDLCRRLGRPFPTELRAHASDWQRQGYDIPWCWAPVKAAPGERRSLVQVEGEVHRHHARLRSEKDARDRAAGEPLATSPSLSRDEANVPKIDPKIVTGMGRFL
jgi:hypothetical protein